VSAWGSPIGYLRYHLPTGLLLIPVEYTKLVGGCLEVHASLGVLPGSDPVTLPGGLHRVELVGEDGAPVFDTEATIDGDYTATPATQTAWLNMIQRFGDPRMRAR
jgi:hypothetical protein